MLRALIGAALAAATMAAFAPPAVAATATTIGQGRLPSLAVDGSGTAYVSWWESKVDSNLLFCRFPRGATACDATPAIGALGSGLTKAPVVVSGDVVTVAAYRYVNPGATSGPSGLFAYTSTDRGATFGSGRVVGSVPFFESVAGPGNTLSGVQENGNPLRFQNVALSGNPPANPDGTSAVPSAALTSGENGYNATVGLLDAATPVVAFQRGEGGAETVFRRYDGSGDLNDAANWTAPVSIGPLYGPQLAGGPKGLFLLGRDAQVLSAGNIVVRRFDGTTFGPAVTIGPGDGVRASDLFQDAGGRLHALYQRGDANGIAVVHAVSDDGMTWRKGDLLNYPPSIGAIVNEGVATAADHIGFGVGESATDPSAIALAPLGPDAPSASPAPTPTPAPTVTPAPARPTPSLTIARSTSARRRVTKVAYKVAGRISRPATVSRSAGCRGTVKVTLLRSKKVLATKTARVDGECEFGVSGTIRRSRVGTARRLTLRLAFSGNPALAPATKNGTVNVKRR